MTINKNTIKKILIIKPRGIGDLILSTIVLKNLKNEIPDCKIHYLTESFASPILKFNPYITKIYEFKNSFFENLRLINRLRKENYDIIFDFYSNPRTAQFTFLTRAKIKIGYDKRGRKYAYNLKVKLTDPNLHSALAHLEFLKILNFRSDQKELLYFITEEERNFADKYFVSNQISENCIGIIPGGGWSSKRCEPEKFAEICQLAHQKFQSEFLILYGNEDKQDAQKIYELTSNISHLAKETSIREMVALISKCRAVIANDSGPMHLSAAIGIPTIGIFGPTNPYAHGPFGKNCFWVRNENLECIQCNLRECNRNHECMIDLNPELVIEKLDLIFKN
ncbi:MAG: lipopolysaccharide heptosyltransferase II [Ignavibacteria bacterium]|nr:lipopolysaccharide heptosyltransferase II [Ignavibacteria bacterium]